MCIFNTSITRLPWWPTLHQPCGAVLMCHILAKTWCHFELCQLDVCEIIHHCCFNLYFHYIRWASLFKSTAILSFSCEFLAYIFCPFFYWSFSHLVSFKNFQYNLELFLYYFALQRISPILWLISSIFLWHHFALNASV